MKALKHCIKLSSSIKIFVPSTINVNEIADTQKNVDKTLRFLSSICGGATASNALGTWISSSGELVKEGVTLVIAYTNQSVLEANIEHIIDFCIAMKIELTQEAIAMEINNELYFI